VKSIRVNKKITKIGLEHSAAKLIPKNSLAIVTRVGVGKVALIPFEYTTSQDFLSLSNLNVDKYFGLYLMYHKLQKELLALQGTSIKGITKKEVLKKRVRVPKDLQEQVSIGKSLKELDSYINLHQRKINILKTLKKVYLNVMFSNRSEDIPRLHFKSFSEAWEQCEVSNLSQKTFGGGTPKTSKKIYWDGDIPWIQSSD